MLNCFIDGCGGTLWRESTYRQCLKCSTKFSLVCVTKAHYDDYIYRQKYINWLMNR